VLSLLPLFVVFVIMVMNREYAMMLIETTRGQKMVMGALVMQAIGIFFIRKIVNIKV